jgi:cytochrome c oxidase assembly protein subunit 15
VLGAYVRLTAAGLGCPDWPGCYGHVTPIGAQESVSAQAAFPTKPLDVGKAWREMIHRYAASTLGLIIVVIAALALTTRRARLVSLPLALVLLATVVFQGILGMLTVTWQLKPLIVTGHLVFGLTTLSLLWWLWLTLPQSSRATRWLSTEGKEVVEPGREPRSGTTGTASNDISTATAQAARVAWLLTMIGLIALAFQIALGGWTSSNYAAIACPDFPKCQNAWWPATDYPNAFVLWRGLTINFEGGVLDNPARVAIHLTHRIGALIATLALSIAALSVLTRKTLAQIVLPATAVLAALALQLTLGISMVRQGFPLELATAHTAGAALLLLSVLALLRSLSALAARARARQDDLLRSKLGTSPLPTGGRQ